jgi:DNA-3-methyladenine glycosylase II
MIHDGRSPKLPFDAEAAIAHLGAADPKLGALIDRAGPFTLKLDPSPSPFESLLESILYQQLHGKAAATIHRRVREYFGGDPAPQLLLDTPDDVLRTAGVSGNKVRALKDLAARTLDGTVPTAAAIRKIPDAEIVERLTQSLDRRYALDLPPGPPRRAPRQRLWRTQRLCADFSAHTQNSPPDGG